MSESIYKIADGPQRLLDHFTLDTSNLTIHWKDATNIPSVLSVQLA
ncbi:hypothetical protein [Bacillus cereus]|nr:hypothetical protein [Bacillus cereus]